MFVFNEGISAHLSTCVVIDHPNLIKDKAKPIKISWLRKRDHPPTKKKKKKKKKKSN